MKSGVARFLRSESGGVVVIAAVALPVMLIAAGAVIDHGLAIRDRSVLQTVSDATALAAARELSTTTLSDARLSAVADGFARPQLADHEIEDGARISTAIVAGQRGVTVAIERPMRQFFSAFLGVSSQVISVRSTATVVGNQKVCVIALEDADAESIYMKSNSWLTAHDCNVYSNSKSPSGVKTDSGIKLTAKMTCSSGGFSGAGQFYGLKITDCPPIGDPLAGRPAPAAGGCKAQNHSVIDKGTPSARHVLTPGTYCGGLFIGGNSAIRLDPGVYVIKDGPFVIDSNADVRGANVGFYLQGEKTTFQFLSNARVVVDAPKDGPMAGLLFFEDRAASLDREHRITSNYVSNLTGTMYLSRGTLSIDATNEVAQQSAFTVIVARKIYLSASPKLVVKSDYGSTDIPVPNGLGPASGTPVLSQ